MTSRHVALLRYITGYLEARGYSPSYRECAAATGIAFSGLQHCFNRLEAEGRIRRLPNRARALEVVRPVSVPHAPDGAPLFVVPLERCAA